MRVVIYPSDFYACGHYRMYWPASVVNASGGAEVRMCPPGGYTGIRGSVVNGHVTLQAPDCDVVVLQRPMRRLICGLVPHLRAKGIAVVVDLDDDLERVHPSNPAYAGSHPGSSADYNWRHLRQACRDATLVTVSTPALMPRYAPHGRVRLLRNYVPERFLDAPRDHGLASVGWAGSLHSHPRDMDVAAGALARLHAEGHELRFVGPDEGMSRAIGVDLPADRFTGNLEFGDWQAAVGTLGVGVAPLADSSFNEAKSWLKPLEYSAAGVPWVASDTPEYARLAKMCGADVARRPREWYASLKRLATDRTLREDRSGMAREAAAGLTIEANAHLWAEAWEHAARTQRQGAVT